MTPGEALTVLAYLAGGMVFWMAARRKRLATDGIAWVALAGFCGGILGAKLTEWVITGALTRNPAAFLDPRYGGRTLIGGILAGWLSVELAKRHLGIRRRTGDLFALALPAGEAVGRIGCLLNGCCYGVASGVPWAVFQHGAWRHPSQVYASVSALAILAILWTIRDRLPREGDLFRMYLLLYGLGRFGVEFSRERTVAFGGLSMAQWFCLEMAVAGMVALAMSRRARLPAMRAEEA